MLDEWIGRMIIYEPPHGPVEYGRIKSFNYEEGVAFVVYGLAAYGDDWREYTAAGTKITDIPDLRLALAVMAVDPAGIPEGT